MEKRKGVFCGVTRMPNPLDPSEYISLKDLVEDTVQHSQSDSNQSSSPTAKNYVMAERLIFQNIQQDRFPEQYEQLKTGKPVSTTSRLLTLAPEFDESSQLIRVGGRLCHAEGLELQTIHPIVLDPHHSATKLLIQDYDSKLCHPGPERVFAEMRRNLWILRGREAVRKSQHNCLECRKWKAKPEVPKMADLPPAHLRLHKPPFYSTGMDCFGPFQIKIGRRCEKIWGIIFKCLTTRCVHIDLLTSIDRFLPYGSEKIYCTPRHPL